jgi:hypothetical protein
MFLLVSVLFNDDIKCDGPRGSNNNSIQNDNQNAIFNTILVLVAASFLCYFYLVNMNNTFNETNNNHTLDIGIFLNKVDLYLSYLIPIIDHLSWSGTTLENIEDFFTVMDNNVTIITEIVSQIDELIASDQISMSDLEVLKYNRSDLIRFRATLIEFINRIPT